jgi:uroporphyrin-III C-methyltransferase
VFLNFVTLALGDSPAAPVIGFAAVTMTAAKTVLYFLQEYFCGWCNTAQNDWYRFWVVFVLTNGTWIVVPTIAALTLGRGLIRALTPRSSVLAPTLTTHDKAANPSPLDEGGKFPTPHGGAPLPLTFHVKKLPVLVVGSNRLAAGRVLTLLEADADVTLATGVPFTSLPEELQHRAAQGQIKVVQATGKEAWQAFLAEKRFVLVGVTDTLIGANGAGADVASDVHAAATALRIPINVSDVPSLSTFTFPSVHRFSTPDGPSNLQVAVSTNGQGCRLAGRIRRDIAARLPSNVGAAVDNIGKLRARAKAAASGIISEDDLATPLNAPVAQATEDKLRRMRWVHQMSEYYSYDQLAAMGPAEMSAALEGDSTAVVLPHHDGKKGRILLVGSGPGHPSLLTVAARYALENATLILSDKLVPAEIIALIPKTTKLHIARKFPGNADGAQNELMDLALAGARAGETVVRLKQGDPFVYGRGGEEVLHFRAHGFEATVVPGVSSALAGPLMVGIPVTQRGVADCLVMCTGVGRAGAAVQLPGYVKSRTLAILMGVARIDAVLEVLTAPTSAGRDGAAFPKHLPIAIVERASSPDQRVLLSTLENIGPAIAAVDQRPPGMILVGWAAMCLEGAGQVDILDGVDEHQAVDRWLGGKKWKTREGLPQDWSWFGSF